MEYKFTDTVLAIAYSMDGIINGSFDLGDDCYHVADEICDEMDEELPALVAYLNEEQGKGRAKDKLMDYLRERLQTASQTIINYGMEHITEPANGYDGVLSRCDNWIDWIDRYFPPDQSAAHQVAQEPAAPAPAGRPSQHGKTIKDYMLLKDDEKKDELLMKLHQLIDGNKGTGAAFVILACESLGIMTKPGHKVMINEFPGIGSRSGYDKGHRKGYMNYSREERTGIEEHLAPFKVALSSNKSPQE